MTDATGLPPAGWYPDAITPGNERYWDGAAWTADSRPILASPPAPAPAPAPAPTPTSAPDDRPTELLPTTPTSAPDDRPTERLPTTPSAPSYALPGSAPATGGAPAAGGPEYAVPAYAAPPAGGAVVKSPLATVAMVLGIVGLVLSAIPAVSFVAFVLCVVAVVLGIRILVAKLAGRTKGLVGLITGGVGVIVSLIASILFIALIGAASNASDPISLPVGTVTATAAPTPSASVKPTAMASASPSATASPKPTGEAPATESPTPGLGIPLEIKQSDGVAKVTIVSATYGPSLGGPFDIEPDNGGYLILDVKWETASGVSSANPLYFSAKTTEGREGDIALGVDEALGSGDVPVGDVSRGNVAYDIGDGPYVIIVKDQLLQEVARLNVEATPR